MAHRRGTRYPWLAFVPLRRARWHQLAADGWDISIDGFGAHHPTTVRVVLERRGEPA
jgi:hypothetical protein